MYNLTGDHIRSARCLIGWDQSDLAFATGMNINTIRNLEGKRHQTVPGRFSTITKIQTALNSGGVKLSLDEREQTLSLEPWAAQSRNFQILSIPLISNTGKEYFIRIGISNYQQFLPPKKSTNGKIISQARGAYLFIKLPFKGETPTNEALTYLFRHRLHKMPNYAKLLLPDNNFISWWIYDPEMCTASLVEFDGVADLLKNNAKKKLTSDEINGISLKVSGHVNITIPDFPSIFEDPNENAYKFLHNAISKALYPNIDWNMFK